MRSGQQGRAVLEQHLWRQVQHGPATATAITASSQIHVQGREVRTRQEGKVLEQHLRWQVQHRTDTVTTVAAAAAAAAAAVAATEGHHAMSAQRTKQQERAAHFVPSWLQVPLYAVPLRVPRF